jgi:hypothetical protein
MGQKHSSLSSATTAWAGLVTKPDVHRTGVYVISYGQASLDPFCR